MGLDFSLPSLLPRDTAILKVSSGINNHRAEISRCTVTVKVQHSATASRGNVTHFRSSTHAQVLTRVIAYTKKKVKVVS